MALIGHMGNLGQLRRIMIAGLILGLGAMPGSVFAGHGQAPGSSKGIHLFQDVTLNGCPQRILVQSDDVEANPLLLFLHGGPGSSALIYSHLYTERLKAHFIMVQWDERGAGFSYREGMDPATISEGQIASDALQLIAYLLKTFHKEKLYLVGQSFGSALGIHLAATHPELFCAYVGMGQVIHYDRSVEITYAWLHGVLEKAGDAESLKKIEKDHFPSIDLVTRYGGHHRLSLDLGAVMRASPYYYDGYAEVLQKGKTFSQECVARNPSAFTAPWTITELKVPVYFFEGVYDHVIACAPELVAEFADKVRAPAKELIWFRDSAHLVNLEEPGKFQDELIRIREKTYYSSSRTVSRRPAGEG